MRIQSRNSYDDEFKDLDPYFTCPAAIESLIKLEGDRLPNTILEPCSGTGAIGLPLRATGRDVLMVDIHAYDERPEDTLILDYLGDACPVDLSAYEGAVTNPPYAKAQAFLEKLLAAHRYVAVLVRSNFYIDAKTRTEFFERYPPTRVWLAAPRLPMMHRYRWTGSKKSPNTPHCWLVWERGSPPTLPQRFNYHQLLNGAEPEQRPKPRRSRRPSAPPEHDDAPATLDAPLPELLARASRLGVGFRPQGRGVHVTNPSLLSSDLARVLRARCAEIRDHLGGSLLDQPSIDLLAQLGVGIIIPQTVDQARAALAKIAADARAYTPRELHDRSPLVGLDIETAILPGVGKWLPVKLNRDGYPCAPRSQPSLKKQTEDAGLDPHRSRVRLLQLHAGGQNCLVLDTDLVPLDTVKEFLQYHTAVIHGAGFECHHLAAAGIEIPHFECTMQAAGLLLGTRRRGLDDVASTYLGLDVPKGLQTSDWGAPYLSSGQLAYAALDAILCFRMWLKLRIDLNEKGRGDAYLLQRDVIRPTTRMIMRGIHIDRAAHARQMANWSEQQTKAETDFTADFMATTGKPFPKKEGKDKAKRDYLAQVLPPDQLETWPLTEKTQQLSLRAADLKRAHLPAIGALLALEAADKLLNTYGTELVNKISTVTGRLHPSYNISAAKTGRFSSSRPNVQQLPSKKKAPEFRQCIAASPGRVLIAGDFHMMEMRAAAETSNDTVMRADFAAGVDLHTQTAATMLGVAYDKVDEDARNRAKAVNFSIIYGAGTNGIIKAAWANYGIELPWEEAETARQSFLCRYATYASWMQTRGLISNQRGMIEIGRFGRVIEAAWEPMPVINGGQPRRPTFVRAGDADDDDGYWIPDNEDDRSFFVGAQGWTQDRLRYTLCCNAPIQGACADASMLSLLKADAALREAKIDGGPILFVHDEIVLEVPEKDAERAEQILKACMEEAFIEVFPDAPRNGLVSTKIGPNWAEAKP